MNNKDKYVKCLEKLKKIRSKNKGKESKEEDTLLDQMDVLWFDLTEKEQKEINTKNTLKKCPICSDGDVIIGDEILNDPYHGIGSHFASCSKCTAKGMIKDNICYNWLAATKGNMNV
jgi:hypothetical protein